MGTEVMQWLILLLFVLVAILFAMLIGLTNLIVDINRRLGPDLGPLKPNDSLEDRTVVPDFAATDVRTRQPVSLAGFAGRRLIMAFLSPTCEPCKELMPHLNRFAGTQADASVVVVLTDGNPGTSMISEFDQHIPVLVDSDKQLARAFRVGRTPLVYLIDEERKVVTRTISNTLIDLEDTLAGLGRPQGGAMWVPSVANDDSNGQVRIDNTTNQGQPTDENQKGTSS